MTNNTPSDLLPELKACPFCGGEAEQFTCEESDNYGGQVIGCKSCSASTRVFFGECEGIFEAWNTRTPPATASDEEIKQAWTTIVLHGLGGGEGFESEMEIVGRALQSPAPKEAELVKEEPTHHCSFCPNDNTMVERVIAGETGVNICSDCVEMSMALILDRRHGAPPFTPPEAPNPPAVASANKERSRFCGLCGKSDCLGGNCLGAK